MVTPYVPKRYYQRHIQNAFGKSQQTNTKNIYEIATFCLLKECQRIIILFLSSPVCSLLFQSNYSLQTEHFLNSFIFFFKLMNLSFNKLALICILHVRFYLKMFYLVKFWSLDKVFSRWLYFNAGTMYMREFMALQYSKSVINIKTNNRVGSAYQKQKKRRHIFQDIFLIPSLITSLPPR